jgi:hypothetical protein
MRAGDARDVLLGDEERLESVTRAGMDEVLQEGEVVEWGCKGCSQKSGWDWTGRTPAGDGMEGARRQAASPIFMTSIGSDQSIPEVRNSSSSLGVVMSGGRKSGMERVGDDAWGDFVTERQAQASA